MTPRAAAMPEKIGRYQILGRVGKGGMGVLYRAFDPVLDREVAVKVMLADFSEDTEQMRPRFYREAKAAAKLQHRNIVTIFEFAEENNQPHIVMEFLKGIQLGSRMEQSPQLTLNDMLDIVAQLCSGLGYAHTQGIVHRDVKPANVFILEDGTVKLLDFGIAKLATSTLTQAGDVLGSAPYMSPEQVSGALDLDGRSDVWSTGVLLYEMLTGRKPFEGDTLTTVIAGILSHQPPSLEKLVPGLPKTLIAVVERALEKDRDRRIPTAEELGRELQTIRMSLRPSALGVAPAKALEETRYASTNVLKALADDRKKGTTTGASEKLLEKADPTYVAPPPSRKGIVAAGAIVGTVAALAISVWLDPARFGLGGTAEATPSSPAPATSAPGTNAAAPVPAPTPAAADPKPIVPASAPVSPPPSAEKRAAAPEPRKVSPPATAPRPAEGVTFGGAKGVTFDTGKPAQALAPDPPPTRPDPPPVRTALVTVALSAAYRFEVHDGGRPISASASTHELSGLPVGRTLRLVNNDVFLDLPVKIESAEGGRFEYSPPALGKLDIRTNREECKILVGKRDLGPPPLPPLTVVSGSHTVGLTCPDGQNPVQSTTVLPGSTRRVNFTR
jgi:serine/threonine protein kinase